MSVDYKQKNDIPDLYNILGLTSDVCKLSDCQEQIHKAYLNKAKSCHPDKNPGKKDAEELFELLTQAYDILRDEKQRTAYNHKLSLNRQSSNDFVKLRKGATDYVNSVGEYKPVTDQQKLDFKKQMEMLDVKHGYQRNTESAPLSKQDAKKQMEDKLKARAAQDLELKPERLFPEGQHIDLKKFNAAFDMVHNRNDSAVMPHNGVPSAWNDLGTVANFSSFDGLDNIYVEDGNRFDTSRQLYSGVDFAQPVRKITQEDMQNIKGADYVDGHSVLDDEYYKQMKEKLRDRQTTTSSFEKMGYNDFKRDDTAGYGIFDQLGLKFDDRIALDVDEDDLSKKFERLMAERQNNGPTNAGNIKPPPKKKSTQGWR